MTERKEDRKKNVDNYIYNNASSMKLKCEENNNNDDNLYWEQ